MKRFRKVYLEISNRCNLNCSFCPGTKRVAGAMSRERFRVALERLKPWTDYLYFHLMGEPLCHPELEAFLAAEGTEVYRSNRYQSSYALQRQEDGSLTVVWFESEADIAAKMELCRLLGVKTVYILQ